MGLLFVSRLLGILFFLFSFSLAPPLVVSLLYDDGQLNNFLLTLVLCMSFGGILWLVSGKQEYRIQNRHGFLIVTLFWLFISFISSLPLILALKLSPAAAFFESASAFTTTGATVLDHLDQMAPSVLFYRQWLQWLGGIGVVVSAIALLPMLGVGGMQLFKAETAGPIKDEKLTPRIAHTAQALWRLYAGMTLVCAVLFWAAGMPLFDAIAHSLSTLSTGGFSTHDASMAYYNSPLLEAITIVFMMLGAISFNVHFVALKKVSLKIYWQSVEVRVFLLFTLAVIGVVTTLLHFQGRHLSVLQSLRHAAFETVSVITSTGYSVDDFNTWPTLLPTLMIFISFVGGCAGSTAGGIKVIRFILVAKQAALEVQHLIHPRLTRPVKLGGKVVSNRVISAVWSFFVLYVVSFVFFMLMLMGDGLDQVSAFGAVAACMNNLGPGLGEVAVSFGGVSDFAKWLLGVAMLLGRLEVFTIMVLLSPAFWRN